MSAMLCQLNTHMIEVRRQELAATAARREHLREARAEREDIQRARRRPQIRLRPAWRSGAPAARRA